MQKREHPPEFDRVVHVFDKKTGKLISTNHYTFHKVKNVGEWYERDGKKFDGTGSVIEKSPVELLQPEPPSPPLKQAPVKAKPVVTPQKVQPKAKKEQSDDLAKAAKLLDA